MRFNKIAVERELDLTAKELDQLGYVDLADKVDYWNEKLMKATSVEALAPIRRALARIEKEANRRANPEKDQDVHIEALKKKIADHKAKRAAEKADADKTKKPTERLGKLERMLASQDEKLEKEASEEELKAKVRKRRLARIKDKLLAEAE